MATLAPEGPNDNEKKIAARCWMAGNKSVEKEQWSYAIEMYEKSVKLDPANLTYRQSLRGAECKSYANNGKGASMANMRLMSTRTSIKTSRLRKMWIEVNNAAEEGLKLNPWDAALNADVGDACKELGFNDVAMFAYETAYKADPTNKHVLECWAIILEEKGEYPQAANLWERIHKLDPYHPRAKQKVTELNTKKVIERGGYDKATTANDMRFDRNKGAADGPGQSVEADLQRAIRKEPANKDNYTKLGDYYRREGKLKESAEQFQLALDVTGGADPGIRERLEDIQLDLMREAVEMARSDAAADATNAELKKRTGLLARELLDREIEVFTSRVERYPQNIQLKFELANRYLRIQKWQAAIPLFQQASSDLRIKGQSLVALGKCFYYDKKLPLARRQFEKAIPDVKFEDEPDLYKDLHYSLGRLAEEMGDKVKAEDCYQTVLEVDYDYKDANARLQKLQSGA